MFSKKVVKKLIDRYKISYLDISKQLDSKGMESDTHYRCIKALKDDYKLKINVLEGVLCDLNMGCIDSFISMSELQNCVNELDGNAIKDDGLSSVSNINNSDTVHYDKDSNQVSSDSSLHTNDSNTLKNDSVILKEDDDALDCESGIRNIDTKEGLVCTFKGYGYKELYGYDTNNVKYDVLNERIERLLVRLIEEKGVTTFLTDGSLGFNKMVYYIVDKLKCKYPHIKNNLALPFLTQDSNWNDDFKADYKYMKSKADSVVYVDSIDAYNITKAPKGEFHTDKLRICNEYMIDNSDVLVALYRGENRGAVYNCINYADRQKLKGVIKLNPGM